MLGLNQEWSLFESLRMCTIPFDPEKEAPAYATSITVINGRVIVCRFQN